MTNDLNSHLKKKSLLSPLLNIVVSRNSNILKQYVFFYVGTLKIYKNYNLNN